MLRAPESKPNQMIRINKRLEIKQINILDIIFLCFKTFFKCIQYLNPLKVWPALVWIRYKLPDSDSDLTGFRVRSTVLNMYQI